MSKTYTTRSNKMYKNLLHSILPVFILVSLSNNSYSAGEWFRSKVSGSWNSTSTWEMSTNNGATWLLATMTPALASGNIYIESGTNVNIPNGETWVDQLTVKTGGTLNCAGNLYINDGPGTDFIALDGSTVIVSALSNDYQIPGSSPSIIVEGAVTQFIIYNFIVFDGAINIDPSDSPSTDTSKIKIGGLNIDPNSTLNCINPVSLYGLSNFSYCRIDINSNSAITGNSIQFNKCKLFMLLSTVSCNNIIFADTTTIEGGSATFAGNTITVNDTLVVHTNVTFSPSNKLIVNSAITARPYSDIGVMFTSGTFVMGNAGYFTCGLITQNNVTLDFRAMTGNKFIRPLYVTSGTTTLRGSNKILPQNLTISSGARFLFPDTVLNFSGTEILNDGYLECYSRVKITGGYNHTLKGSGTTDPEIEILGGNRLTVLNEHQLGRIIVDTGAVFDVSGIKTKYNLTRPLYVYGTFYNNASTIVYNGSSYQVISVDNIDYRNLTIDNPAGTTILNNETVDDTLNILQGFLYLNGNTITLSPSGFLIETPGHTVNGTTGGGIQTTRNLNAPSALNVGGLGAVITSSSNLGTTLIKRGHTIQTTAPGGTSITRYFDISPANNTNLNATLVFKFDNSELNGLQGKALKLYKSTNSGSNWTYMGGQSHYPAGKDITLSGINSFSRWTADTNTIAMIVNVFPQGFYNSSKRLNMKDTVRAYLRESAAPYAIVDSSLCVIDSLTFRGELYFETGYAGTYYIQVKHRNSLETWSKTGGEDYNPGVISYYDFTTAASQAFGDNMVQVDAGPVRFGIYSGDVNQDGTIDLSDIRQVFNAAKSFLTGYVVSDVNGDNLVDLSDLTLTFNNSNAFISVVKP